MADIPLASLLAGNQLGPPMNIVPPAMQMPQPQSRPSSSNLVPYLTKEIDYWKSFPNPEIANQHIGILRGQLTQILQGR